MYLPSFNYCRPESLAEALCLLTEPSSTSKILAGGTDLLVAMKQRRTEPELLIDLSQLAELTNIELAADGRLKIGALATLTQVAQSDLVKNFSPALAQAAWETGSPLLRNRGTVGGNIFQDTRCRYYNQSASWRQGKAVCLKMKGDVCHINPGGKRCLSTYAGDLAPVFLAEEATIELVTAKETKEVQLLDIFTGDGFRPYQLPEGALATAVYLKPANKGEKKFSTYWKLRSRPSLDFPLVGISVALIVAEESRTRAVKVNIGVTGVASRPQLAVKAGAKLAQTDLSLKNLTIAKDYLMKEIKVVDTGNSPAWYRKEMLGQGFMEAMNRLLGEGGNI